MKWKKILIVPLIFSLGLIYGCSNSGNIFPTVIPLENSIKEIIISKGENYDFMGDELFNAKVDDYATSILGADSKNHYALGNLDEDNVPELVIYLERNYEDLDDQGGLGVYKFKGEKYELLDKIDMNYDNSNYLLEIGKISSSQNGILISNQVGAHSSMTYGYILKDQKLKSILNGKKISLVSVYSNNEIKDIDDDGILEFSIYTIDPETKEQSSEGSDKIILWYKWDGMDSGDLIKVIKEPTEDTTESLLLNSELDLDDPDFISNLKYNTEIYDNVSLSEIIESFIINLNKSIAAKGIEVEDLFDKYQKNYSFDYLSDKYGLSIEKLNDVEYLEKELILQSEMELKEYLISNINRGYKLNRVNENYYYAIDYQKFINSFGDSITNQFKDYLKIKSLNSNEPYIKNESLIISQELLAERIAELERFSLIYPYSSYLNEINKIYKEEVATLLYGSHKSPTYNLETKVFNVEIKEALENIIIKYPHTHLSDIVKLFLKDLESSLNILSDDVKNNVNKLIE